MAPVMSPDPFGRAIRDHYHGDQDEPLIQRDGEETLEHPIEQFYFSDFSADDEQGEWLESWLDGPLLDIGAGVGKHTLYFQEHFPVVAIEKSHHLVETMDERGVNDPRQADMFALREAFERDRFRSALAYGTHLGLTGSMQELRRFLGDLAYVTVQGASAVIDCYDPTAAGTANLLGYRADSAPGLAHRVMEFEYQDEIGEILLFRLFSPDRIAEAVVGTSWDVMDVRRPSGQNDYYYQVALMKE